MYKMIFEKMILFLRGLGMEGEGGKLKKKSFRIFFIPFYMYLWNEN